MSKSKDAFKTEVPFPLEKQAYRPKEFQQAYGIAKSYFYEQVARDRLKIIKAGKATLVTRDAVNDWLALCAAETFAARQKKAQVK